MDWSVMWSNRDLYGAGLWATVELSVAAIATCTLLGLVIAAIRTSRIPVLAQLARCYLEVFRGTPLLVQMLFIYFGAVYLNIGNITVFGAALLALTLFQGAYVAEIFRAGIEAVPHGQWEASRVLGLTRAQTFRSVILPQTRSIVLPRWSASTSRSSRTPRSPSSSATPNCSARARPSWTGWDTPARRTWRSPSCTSSSVPRCRSSSGGWRERP
ncbi:hypothetical protein SVIO_089030 [Streptomyces violaceusniger]|uniref:ABC transmembrane type-1 domain-containing protein n=1 Tax=Streptomyces violaceusniger TaxID=68280 RepID=A0A4D4LGM9_STRVO|nr:hypothetical protein SVIO_089030 [Streptomyces violaceusniger]